ncbi:MAG: zinc ABC transporter substrate-binding protein, partial [Pseudomonadota bacterium]
MGAARFTITTALALSLSGFAATNMAQAESLKLVTTIPPLAGITSDVLDGVAETHLLIRNGGSPHAFTLRPSDAAKLAEADYVMWVGEGLETFLAGKLSTLAPTAVQIEAMELPGVMVKEFREGGHDHDDHGHGDHGHDEHGHDDHGHDDHGHDDHGHDDHGHDDHAHDDHGHDDHGHDEEKHAHSDHDEHHDHDHKDEAHAGHDHHGHDHSGADPHIWLEPDNAVAIARALADVVSEDLSEADAKRVRNNLAGFEA